jgi:hypothetical protein
MRCGTWANSAIRAERTRGEINIPAGRPRNDGRMSTCGSAGIRTAVCGRSRCGSGRRSRRADDLAFREPQRVIHPFQRRRHSARSRLGFFLRRAEVRSWRQAALRGRPAEGIKSPQSGGCGNQFVDSRWPYLDGLVSLDGHVVGAGLGILDKSRCWRTCSSSDGNPRFRDIRIRAPSARLGSLAVEGRL